ncbi:uridine kinase family protein [Marinoscillum sp.]|uniref:uridine kinase family protein n=1 Tax=Marinoscillum sp. TaxID=2024838 RepID=UPI003BACE180
MIIGIGGVSRAGKTTLAKRLKEHFEKKGKSVDVYCQDEYVKPTISLPKVQGVPDWERPSTIKWDKLLKDVHKSKSDIKIIEGLFSFYPASLRSEYVMKIFVEIEKSTFQERKSKDMRWDEEPEWYAEHVWRSYLKYGQMKGDKEEYIPVSGEQEIDLTQIVSLIPN